MAVNYDDSRFQEVEREKEQALNNVSNTYQSMINSSDAYYQDLRNAVDTNAQKQTEIQQANTDFALEQMEQQKEKAQKDYEKEQRAAYVDYMKQSDKYGANAEQMLAQGLENSGYSATIQQSMYNTYQNRYATARETYNNAVLNYDNNMKEARLSNNAKLAEISANALEKSLQLALQGYQYKNTLLQTKLSAEQQTEQNYYSRWQDVLNQINTENALAEQKRQFNASLNANKQTTAIQKYNDENSQINKENQSYTDTGFELSGYKIYKSGNEYYYQKPDGTYSQLPVIKETKNTITIDDGTVITKNTNNSGGGGGRSF